MLRKYHLVPHQGFSLRRKLDNRHGVQTKHQDITLSRREAKAASPEDMAVCGEEDPGEALEFLVTDKNNQ